MRVVPTRATCRKGCMAAGATPGALASLLGKQDPPPLAGVPGALWGGDASYLVGTKELCDQVLL